MFLNRVAGTYWEHPRRLIQEWANRLPDEAYADIRGRLQKDNHTSQSAFLELYLHESLLRAGYEVTVHPEHAHTRRHVDFFAQKGDENFYLEAVMPKPDRTDPGRDGRLASFLDSVNQLQSDAFFLELQDVQVGQKAVATGALRRDLATWLRTLDSQASSGSHDRPSYVWSHGDWSARFSAWANPRGNSVIFRNRAIGIYSQDSPEFIDDAGLIKRGAESKSRGYGDLDAPFVVAVGVYLFDRDLDDAVAAMYGQNAWVLEKNGQPASFYRMADGFFGTAGSPRNARVSAVLVVNQLQPWHVELAQLTLFRNPRGLRPLTAKEPFFATEVLLDKSTLHMTPRVGNAAAFFDVENWSMLEPWPA
jgi:hypothetical protein